MATRYLPTPLGNAFFSEFNRESIHSALTNDVQGKTGYVIDRQSDSDLQAIMKSVYIRMAYDEYQDIRGQVGKMNAAVVSDEIMRALHRSWLFDPKTVAVSVHGGVVRLTGTVRSWEEWRTASNAAWSAPGVVSVENDISIA